MAWLFSDIKTWLADQNADDNSARAIRNYLRMANDANRAMHEAGDWSFDRTKIRLLFDAAKNGGTVAITIDAGAVVGVGTAFSTAGLVSDIGKYFRFNAQPFSYRCTAVADGTHATVETYRGATLAAGGFSYWLTHDRVALDTRFRKFSEPQGDDTTFNLKPVDLDMLLEERMHVREVTTPRICAWEYDQANASNGAAPSKYMWVYPSPLLRQIIEVPVYHWPYDMAVNGDSISAPPEAESVHREFLRWQLLLDKGKSQEAENQLKLARAFAKKALSGFRFREDMGARQQWSVEADTESAPRRRRVSTMAPGEPVSQ